MSQLPDEDAMTAAISPGDVAALRILQGALTLGPLLFLTVTLALPLQVQAGAPPPRELLAALAVVALGGSCAAFVLPGVRYRALARRLRDAPPADPAAACAAWINELRGVRILTLALLEGPALFGVVVLFMHRAAGVEPSARPELWGVLAPLGVLALHSAATWPSARSFASGWRRHVLESP